MKLLEYEAKDLLHSCSIPVPRSEFIEGDSPPHLQLPAVIKSQVPVGGRGKAGGIRIVSSKSELQTVKSDLLNLRIKGFLPRVLLAEEVIAIDRELYVSLLINRELSAIELVAHREGGVEVESHESRDFFTRPIEQDAISRIAIELANYLDLPSHTAEVESLIQNLYDCMAINDATLIEINPLVLTKGSQLLAADCKMELDDAAGFRHPDWNFEAETTDSNFVTLSETGTVATIANGAGLAMATVDAVTAAGLTPANFLDIGGGATTEGIRASFGDIMKFPSVNAIVINIFGGIVRCDVVAAAIIEARSTLPDLPPLYIRLSGTNAEQAKELLAHEGVTLYETLGDALEAIS